MPFGECAREHMQEFDLESMLNIIDLISKQRVNLSLDMLLNTALTRNNEILFGHVINDA